MSLLENIVKQVAQNALNANQSKQSQNQDVLGGLLGSVLGGQQSNQNSGLGGILGQVVASQLGGNQANNQANSGLGGLLGGLLGGQQQQTNPSDLGSVLGGLLGATNNNRSSGGFNKNTLLLALLPVVLSYIQKNGGLSGVLAKFNGNGLGNKAQSWVNVDTDNDGLDADDVLGLFGRDEINQVCEQTGASQNDVCQGIAELLPQVVNDLTPAGGLQHESEANQEIAEILRQLGK